MSLAVDSTALVPSRPISRPTLAELFQAHARFVWRVLAAHGIRDADIEDAAQEVFLIVHRRMEDWDPARAAARTWLYAIASRVAANHRKRVHHSREQSSAELEHPAGGVEPEAEVDRSRLIVRLEQAIAALDDAKRDVFVLFELQELSMKEVADTVGCPVQTAYARLYAARRAIAEAIGEGGVP